MKLMIPRSGLGRAGRKLRNGSCTIGYCAASNGQMHNGWRTGIHQWLNATFPQAESHREVNCCFGAHGSLIGVYNAREKFTAQKPDLVFIEYSQIDLMICAPLALTEHSAEALVRTIKSINPDCEICFLYYYNFRTDDHANGRYTPVEKIYEKIAEHYGIPSISVAQFVMKLSNSGAMHLTGENDLPAIYRRDLYHPTIEGNRRVTGFLCAQLKKLLARKTGRRSAKLIGPLHPVRIQNWRGYKVRPDMFSGKFKVIHVPAGKYGAGKPAKPLQYFELHPGGKLTFEIHGHLAAIVMVIGPHAGVVRCRVGDNVEVRNLFDAYCFKDRTGMYVPSPYPDVHEAPQTREIVLELMNSLPKDNQGLTPSRKPSKWTVGILGLWVIGRLR